MKIVLNIPAALVPFVLRAAAADRRSVEEHAAAALGGYVGCWAEENSSSPVAERLRKLVGADPVTVQARTIDTLQRAQRHNARVEVAQN